MKHTEGKLHTSPTLAIRDERGDSVADVYRPPSGHGHANAERLTICWNEFEGIPTSEIPGSVTRLVQASLAMYKHFGGDEIIDDGIYHPKAAKVVQNLRAALAAFEKKGGE